MLKKTNWSTRKKYVYNYLNNKKNWRKYQYRNFFKIASQYSYAKIDCELFFNAMLQSNGNYTTGYRLGFTEYPTEAQQYESITFKQLLTGNNEYNAYKIQYQNCKIRGLAFKLMKVYDPLDYSNAANAECINKNLIKFFINMNADISGNEQTYKTPIEMYPHQVYASKYIKNTCKEWNPTTFATLQNPNSTNNGEIMGKSDDGVNTPLNDMIKLCKYKVRLTFYILFKSNKYN